jgi:hypothetical protein
MLISGEAHDEIYENGRPVPGETLLLLLNAGAADCRFELPTAGRFEALLTTAGVGLDEAGAALVPARSLVLLARRAET